MKAKLSKLSEIFKIDFEIIDSAYNTGQFNMDFDVELKDKAEKENKAFFRLYGWNPWCLSLGYNQKDDTILINEINDSEYDLVRRPTGGRAVFHADEITYSIAIPLRDDLTHHDVYREIHLLLAQAFQKLDIHCDLEKSNPDLRSHYSTENSAMCFSSSARYEIENNGKKIVGSAQRLFGKILLQHGSILLNQTHLGIVDFIKTQNKDILKEFLKNKSISLSELTGKDITYEDVSKAILQVTG